MRTGPVLVISTGDGTHICHSQLRLSVVCSSVFQEVHHFSPLVRECSSEFNTIANR